MDEDDSLIISAPEEFTCNDFGDDSTSTTCEVQNKRNEEVIDNNNNDDGDDDESVEIIINMNDERCLEEMEMYNCMQTGVTKKISTFHSIHKNNSKKIIATTTTTTDSILHMQNIESFKCRENKELYETQLINNEINEKIAQSLQSISWPPILVKVQERFILLSSNSPISSLLQNAIWPSMTTDDSNINNIKYQIPNVEIFNNYLSAYKSSNHHHPQNQTSILNTIPNNEYIGIFAPFYTAKPFTHQITNNIMKHQSKISSVNQLLPSERRGDIVYHFVEFTLLIVHNNKIIEYATHWKRGDIIALVKKYNVDRIYYKPLYKHLRTFLDYPQNPFYECFKGKLYEINYKQKVNGLVVENQQHETNDNELKTTKNTTINNDLTGSLLCFCPDGNVFCSVCVALTHCLMYFKQKKYNYNESQLQFQESPALSTKYDDVVVHNDSSLTSDLDSKMNYYQNSKLKRHYYYDRDHPTNHNHDNKYKRQQLANEATHEKSSRSVTIIRNDDRNGGEKTTSTVQQQQHKSNREQHDRRPEERHLTYGHRRVFWTNSRDEKHYGHRNTTTYDQPRKKYTSSLSSTSSSYVVKQRNHLETHEYSQQRQRLYFPKHKFQNRHHESSKYKQYDSSNSTIRQKLMDLPQRSLRHSLPYGQDSRERISTLRQRRQERNNNHNNIISIVNYHEHQPTHKLYAKKAKRTQQQQLYRKKNQ